MKIFKTVKNIELKYCYTCLKIIIKENRWRPEVVIGAFSWIRPHNPSFFKLKSKLTSAWSA